MAFTQRVQPERTLRGSLKKNKQAFALVVEDEQGCRCVDRGSKQIRADKTHGRRRHWLRKARHYTEHAFAGRVWRRNSEVSLFSPQSPPVFCRGGRAGCLGPPARSGPQHRMVRVWAPSEQTTSNQCLVVYVRTSCILYDTQHSQHENALTSVRDTHPHTPCRTATLLGSA